MYRVRAVPKRMRELPGLATVAAAVFLTVALAGLAVSPLTGWEWLRIAGAQDVPPVASLKGVPVPGPANIGEFIKDTGAAVKLGKSLFWDMQVGSDGIQACASCHFNRGADSRSKNQVSPGLLGGDETFQIGGPNFQLSAANFPLSGIEENDVISSQGVQFTKFLDIIPGSPVDRGEVIPDPVFNVGGVNVRRVEPRHTPTMINAVFNFHNFWDGRADNIFNGVNPSGAREENARVLKVVGTTVEKALVRLENSSAASQAVGPPLSEFEMSWAGRTFPKLGKKMLSLTPLGRQKVHPEDSVLGPNSLSPQPGLSVSYQQMIMDAFQAQWWSSTKLVDGDLNVVGSGTPSSTDQFTVMEANFSLFWGLAIQEYERTLISDDTPFDRFMEGDATALTAEQQDGLAVFTGQGQCSQCHGGPLFTRATVADGPDSGFFNTGVRPTAEDPGRKGAVPDAPVADGAVKTPGLRDVELTAPFFHNGGKATLEDAVDFYRGPDFQNQGDRSAILDDIQMGGGDVQDVAAFLRALTDDRVRFERAPFDHPQLFIPNGHPGDHNSVSDDGSGQATQLLLEIPAVGSNGLSAPVVNFPAMSFAEGEPPKVGSVAATLSFGSIQEGTLLITWALHPLDPGVVAGYNVYRSAVSGVPLNQRELVGTVSAGHTGFLDTGLADKTTFFYVITARDAAGNETPPSAEVSSAPAPPPGVVDTVSLTLTPTGVIPGASGAAEMTLGFVADLGVNGLLASATAQGLTPNVRFSMCVGGTFIDDDMSITGTVLMDEGIESSLTSLSGLNVTIRQGIGCDGAAVLQATVP